MQKKGGAAKGSGDISSARVTYTCAAITDLLSKPVYRKVFSCEVHQARKLTPRLVKREMDEGPRLFHVTMCRPLVYVF